MLSARWDLAVIFQLWSVTKTKLLFEKLGIVQKIKEPKALRVLPERGKKQWQNKKPNILECSTKFNIHF